MQTVLVVVTSGQNGTSFYFAGGGKCSGSGSCARCTAEDRGQAGCLATV